MRIVATPLIVPFQQKKSNISIIFSVLLGAVLVFAIILRIWSTRKCSSHKKIFVDLDITLAIVKEYHEDAEKIQELNALLFRNQIISEEETRIQFNKKFHSLELETHNGSQEETILCLKTNLTPQYMKQFTRITTLGF